MASPQPGSGRTSLPILTCSYSFPIRVFPASVPRFAIEEMRRWAVISALFLLGRSWQITHFQWTPTAGTWRRQNPCALMRRARPIEDSEAMAALWQKTDLIAPMALRVAATPRLPDHIAAGHTSTAELAAASGCDPDGLERLVRYLALEDVLTIEDSGRIDLGPVGACLRGDHPAGARAWFDLESFGGRMSRCAFDLLEAIRSGGPVWERAYGSNMWDDLEVNPALSESFNSLMATQSTALHPHVVDAYPWSDLGHVIDVGGGTGTLLAALAAGHPSLTGKVVDLPLAVEGARGRFADSGLDGRLSAQEGNFFDPLPVGADAYLLSSIIHDWDDERASRILRRCADAAGSQGRVIVIDAVLGEHDARFVATMDLRMLMFIGGRERSLADYEMLVSGAGMTIEAVTPLPLWGRAIIDCRLLD